MREPVAARCVSALNAYGLEREEAQAAYRGKPRSVLAATAHCDSTDQKDNSSALCPMRRPTRRRTGAPPPTLGRILTD
jgi:hypothetical protein